MNNIPNIRRTNTATPPAFMATTRQKIYLMQHHLPVEENMYIKHPRTMNAIHSIKKFVEGVMSIAK